MDAIDEKMMRLAIKEALKSLESGDVPVGCIITDAEGKIVARARNAREKNSDATAHAEILAIKKAGKKTGRWNLTGCTMFVTLEPCAMCAGAAVNARIKRIVYGAQDLRFGCCGTVFDITRSEKLNHRCEVTGGVLREECLEPLQNFFKTLRMSKNNGGKSKSLDKKLLK